MTARRTPQLPYAVRADHTRPHHSGHPWTLADTAAADYMRSTAYDPLAYEKDVPKGVKALATAPVGVLDYTWRGEGDGLRLRDAGREDV